MRLLILPVLIILALSSCSSYQYLTIDSSQVPKNNKKEFSWENDTMRMTYNFNGEDGPVTISIFNKTDKPLYINWKKSALVLGGHSTSLFNTNVQLTGTASTYSVSKGAGFANLSASFDMPEGMNFIPPGSDLTKNLGATVRTSPLTAPDFTDTAQSMKGTYPTGFSYRFRRYTFDEHQSPLQFKSYLTFVLGYNNSLEFSVSHSFYAGEVVVTKEDPTFYAAYRQGGDKLYIKQPSQ